MATIGSQLQTARKARGWTQQDVADRLHVTRQTISNWELGRSYPDAVSLIACSECFSLSLDEMLKGDAKIMDSLSQKEAERRGAKAIYRGSLAVDILLLALLLMHHFEIFAMTMGEGTELVIGTVMVINVVVLLYATRRYRQLQEPHSPQIKRRSYWMTGLLLLVILGVCYLLFGMSAMFAGALVSILVGFRLVKLIYQRL